MVISEPDHIVAIGASAGGLEELSLFFDHTPSDGISYVIVQHLSSDFKSQMAKLLARHSKLEIKEAENGMLVRSNIVYLIPHDKFMTIKDGRLWLSEKDTVRGPHMTINTLAKSTTLPYMAGGEGAQQGTLESLTEEGSEKLAARLNSLILYIDEDKNVVKAYGDTGQFLLSKNFKQNLEDLLPYPLLIALNSLVSQALKTNKEVQANRIAVPVAEFSRVVNISVSPLTESHRGRRMMLLTFMNDLSQDKAGPMTDEYNEKTLHDEFTSDLELEVKQLKQKLSDASVRLDANNENIQSFHEELLSANEEMQSTNEEMQSVNEEMHTINSDYQLKNRELLELNDDLNNYFRSNVNGQLFVNTHLELVRFSPGIVKQINFLPSDIGRPLSDISTNLKLENIEGDIKAVLA